MQLLSLPGTFAHLNPNVLLSTVLNSSHSPFFTHNVEPSFTFTLFTLKDNNRSSSIAYDISRTISMKHNIFISEVAFSFPSESSEKLIESSSCLI